MVREPDVAQRLLSSRLIWWTFAAAEDRFSGSIEVIDVGSVIKKRRKKMRKHKQRKLLKRQRHKK